VTREADDVQRPELAGADEPVDLAVRRVEPALEAELEGHARANDLVRKRDRVSQARRERLLAERREAAADRRPDQLRVGPGGRRDHDGVGTGEGRVARFGRLDPGRRRDIGRARTIDVRDDDRIDAGRGPQQSRVEPADPAGAEERDPHGAGRMTAVRGTRG
jgi:hypothetical protein